MGSAALGGVWRGVGCKEQQYLQQIGTFKIKSGTSEAVREWRRGDRDGGWGMKMGAPLAPVLCCGSLSLTVARSVSVSSFWYWCWYWHHHPKPKRTLATETISGGVSMVLISAEVNDVARIRSENYPYTEENVLNSSGPNIGWLCHCSLSLSWSMPALAVTWR